MPLTPAQADALNAAATYYPFDQMDDNTVVYPCIEVGGVQVYVYAHPERGTLQISVHPDGAEEPLLVNDLVPMRIDLTGGAPLYVADEHGEEDYPLLMAELAEIIDEARAG